MAHELEMAADGSASFAYAGNVGPAWHRLGVELDGLSDVPSILAAARADYDVKKDKLWAVHPQDDSVIIDTGKYFTWRHQTHYSDDGVPGGTEPQCLGIVGSEYRTLQNETATEVALELAGMSPNKPNIDCAGVMNEGRRFFATIPLPDLVIDPKGVKDVHKRHLVVVTGHDGTQALEMVNSVTRAVCSNTVSAALSGSKFKIRIRHVGTVEMAISEAKKKLGLVLDADEEFEAAMLAMLGKKAKWINVKRIADKLWPLADGANDRQVTYHATRLTKLENIWQSDRASESYGENQYSVFQTLTEYMEHEQHIVGESNVENRAVRALDSAGFSKRVRSLAEALQSGQAVRDLKV